MVGAVKQPQVGARSTVALAVATAAGNGLAYVFTIAMSRLLGAVDFGALGTLLGVWLIAQVPATALQLTVARSVAADSASVPRLLSLGVRLGSALAVLLALLAWPLASLLHVPVAAALWLAVGQLPTMVLFAALGVAQGRSRFGTFGLLLAGFHAVRLVAGVLAAAVLDLGVSGVLAAVALAATAAASYGWIASRDTGLDAAAGAAGPDRALLAHLLRGTASMGALLLLTVVDLLLAGHYLGGDARGVYATGNVLTRVAFWGPQFIGTLAYPWLARPSSRDRARRLALLAVGAIGGLGVLLAAVAGRPVVGLVFGPAYAPLGPIAALFVLVGAAAAILNVVLLDDVATGRALGTRLSYAAAAVEALLIAGWRHASPAQVVSTAAVVCALTAVVAVAVTTRPGSTRSAVAVVGDVDAV
jgi:O-antigen/teichoic acid export membrane protein